MTYNSQRNAALDPDRPIEQRASHLRSCALLVGRQRSAQRSTIIATMKNDLSVSIEHDLAPEDIMRYVQYLDRLKEELNRR